MSDKEFTKEFLEKEYHENKKSIPQIASENGTYANKVRRAMISFGIPTRDKSESNRLALESGRLNHPTSGTERSDEEKLAIGKTQTQNYKDMTEEEKQILSERGKELWEQKSYHEQQNLHNAAHKALQKTSKEGSKLENFLRDFLVKNGYEVLFHQKRFCVQEKLELDLFIPKLKTAVEIDGPSHFFDIWGSDTFRRTQKADKIKSGLILKSGLVMLRVVNRSKGPTYNRMVADAVLAKLEEIKKEFPAKEDRYILLDVE